MAAKGRWLRGGLIRLEYPLGWRSKRDEGASRLDVQTYVSYRLSSRTRVVVPLFLCVPDVRYLVCRYILPRYSRGCQCTRTLPERAVCMYKSDLIALDDSSANIRALIADVQTFIAFRVDAAVAGSTILGWPNFALVQRVVLLPCITGPMPPI